MQVMRTILKLLVLVPLMAGAPALAQEVEITAPPPQRERLVIPPGDHEQVTRPSDADYYSRTPAVRQDPAFFRPLSRRTEAGRVGVAGWTAPAPPVSAAQLHREVTGWIAVGVAIEWGAPLASRPAVRPRAR
jgi:hypothetical protein